MTVAVQGCDQRLHRGLHQGPQRWRGPRTGPLVLACLLVAALLAQQAQATERCSEEAAEYLEELPLAEGEIKSVRLMEKVNIADDFGPDIFGVDAWVRLNSCSGWLVLNMSKGCFVRQAYTRGDCQIEGLAKY
ncbi:hypothetical protein [Pelagibius sp.]|uniref:hypothetical protein n=1 Tax=Pelagibius sp. TaxID=1931238 RepID=UPI002637AEFD|nr:hypothetical protein [Pelagibius sp.]